MDSNHNPLFDFEPSLHDTAPSSPSAASAGVLHPPPPAATTLQTVNIRSHVPVVLDLAEPNYAQWRCFFDSVVGKFGIHGHLSASPSAADRLYPNWAMVDQCLISWLYNSVSTDVLDIVRAPNSTAYSIWTAIDSLFHDNELHRAVYLEAEYRSLYQGDLSISQYYSKLKLLADALRDVGQPVSNRGQVLNMLRGLNPKYRSYISGIANSRPPHTFLSTRSYLLLGELYDKQQEQNVTHHALLAQGGSRPPSAPRSGDTSSKPKQKKKSKGRGNTNSPSPASGSSGGGNSSSSVPRLPTAPTYNPWTGLVQAWSMPFQAPGAGIPGPRPGTPPQQAYYAASTGSSPAPAPAPTSWDQQGLLHALATAGAPTAGASTSDWFLDTGASSHMASGPGNLPSLRPLPSPQSIVVGNGDHLSVAHGAATSIPTSSSPLHLNNILVSPSLIKNLIYVRTLTRDNNVSVEFDPFGFSIKDLATRAVKLRCNSSGGLYPLHPVPEHALHASTSSVDLWHRRLRHPGRDSMAATLRSFGFTCDKSAPHICHACQLGKHVRLPFFSFHFRFLFSLPACTFGCMDLPSYQ